MDRLIGSKRRDSYSSSSQNSFTSSGSVPGLSSMQSRLSGSHQSDRKRFRSYVPDESSPKFIPKLYKEAQQRKIPNDDEDGGDEALRDGCITGSCLSSILPNDCEAALIYLSKFHPKGLFSERLPTIILSSQLYSVLQNSSISSIEYQLKTLIYRNKIIVFPTFSSPSFTTFSSAGPTKGCGSSTSSSSTSFLVVFYDEFINLKKHQSDRLFQDFVTQVLPYENTEENPTQDIIKRVNIIRLISKSHLMKQLKLQSENDLRRLVNGGYLGLQENGFYCLSLPGAGEFIKVWEKGRKVLLGNIRRAKFGEILQHELERRSLSKTVPLGVAYHIADLTGSGQIESVKTTSGSLLRVQRNI